MRYAVAMLIARPLLCCLVLVAACSHESKPAPENTPAKPTETAAKPAEPAAKPAEPAPPAAQPWEAQTGAFLTRFGEAMDAANGDCTKLVAGMKQLVPDAQALAKTLKDTGHKFAEFKPDAAFEARFKKHDGFLDRCEKEKTPGFDEAVNATLLAVAPFEPDMKGVDLGGTFAPK